MTLALTWGVTACAGCSETLSELAPEEDLAAREYVRALAAHDWERAGKLSGLEGGTAEAEEALKQEANALGQGKVTFLGPCGTGVGNWPYKRTELDYEVLVDGRMMFVVVTVSDQEGKRRISLTAWPLPESFAFKRYPLTFIFCKGAAFTPWYCGAGLLLATGISVLVVVLQRRSGKKEAG